MVSYTGAVRRQYGKAIEMNQLGAVSREERRQECANVKKLREDPLVRLSTRPGLLEYMMSCCGSWQFEIPSFFRRS